MSVKMLSASKELTKVEKYRLMLSPEILTLQKVADNEAIEVAAFCEFEDVNEETGEVSELLGILATDGHSYVTQSKTFKESFKNIADIFVEDGETFSIRKISGKTNAGRDYINCVLA